MDAQTRLAIKRDLFWRLDGLGSATRSELLRVLSLGDDDRAIRIGTFYTLPELRPMAEMLIDLENAPAARALVVGELKRMRG